MHSKLQPAFLGGLFSGILSALPLVSIGNCCCLWVIGGGVLASYLMLQRSAVENIESSLGDGLAVGLLAGVLGAFIFVVLSIPIDIFMGPIQRRIVEQVFRSAGEMPPGLQEMLRDTGFTVMSVIAKLVFGVIMIVFSAAGGLLGVVLFRKPAPPASPPWSSPPDQYPPPPSTPTPPPPAL
jgi:hypothetical protein